ncbi:MAG: hypothetical protein J6T82_08535 [Bacteroidaceae bacterium]|nr:hypothetical protein [Bacteroidaceae bacterium]
MDFKGTYSPNRFISEDFATLSLSLNDVMALLSDNMHSYPMSTDPINQALTEAMKHLQLADAEINRAIGIDALRAFREVAEDEELL